MLEILPMQVSDMVALIPREPDRTSVQGFNLEEEATKYRSMGPAFTGWWDSQPMVCAGIVKLWPGLGEGWAYTSSLVNEHPIVFYRAFLQMVHASVKAADIRRLQVTIPKMHYVSCRWLRRMGFTRESTMPKFGPKGEKYFRYVRFF